MADGKVTIAIDLDGKKAQGDINSLKSALGGLGSTFKSVLGANLISGALMSGVSALTGGIKSSFSSAISEGAKLQQSIGGIETLFKGSADKVKQYASESFRTAGISANEYMENVTSFSASLIQSLGGDTEAAAELANTALKDMSDNANKMGTDMAMVTQTYQSLARGNYQMLDNLKLGYGGTKAELNRLIKDAASYTDVQEELNMTVEEGNLSFANIVKAISIVQKKLDITGTTAKEASETFSGSFSSMRAAFKDFLGNLTTGADIKKPLGNLAKTASTFVFKNAVPMIANAFKALPSAISTFLESAKPEIEAGLKRMLPEATVNKITATLAKIGDAMKAFKDTGAITAVSSAFNALKDAVSHVFSAFWGHEDTLTNLGKSLGEIVKFLADVAKKGADFISSLPPETIKTIAGAVAGAVFAFKGFKVVTGILQGLVGVFQLIKFALTANPFMLAVVAIGALVGAFITAYNTSDTFRAKVDDVVKSIKKFVDGLDPKRVKSWSATIGAVVGGFAVFKMLNGWNPFKMFSKNGKGALDAVGDALDKTSGKSQKAKGIITQVFTGLGNLIKSAGQGIATAAKGIGTGLSTAFKGLGTGIATAAKGIGTAVSTMAQGFGRAAAMANPAQWLSMGAAMLMVGAGVALVAGGIYILVQAAIQLASAGSGAALALVGLGVGIGLLAGLFALLGPALTAGAVGIIAFGAAVALIGAGVYLATTGIANMIDAFASAEGAITATGQAISTAVQGFGEAIKTTLDGVANVFRSVGDAIKSAFEGIGGVIESVGNSIKSVLDGIAGVIDSIGNAALNAGKGFNLLANGVVKITNTNLGDMAASLGAVAVGVGKIAGHSAGLAQAGSGMQSLGTGMTTVSASATMAVAGLTMFVTRISTLSTTVGTLPTMLTTAATGFASFTAQAVGAVAGLSAINAPIAMFNAQIMTVTPALMIASAGFASFGFSILVTSASLGVAGAIIGSLTSQLSSVSSAVSSAVASFQSMTQAQAIVKSVMDAIVTIIHQGSAQMAIAANGAGNNVTRNMASAMSSSQGSVTSAMQSIVSAVRSTAMAGVGSMRSVGSYIGQGLAEGMYSSLGAVTAAANALVEQAERAARAKAQIHSPSRLFRDSVGRFLPMGVAVGIERGTKYVDKALGGMYDHINAFSYKAEDIIGAGKAKLSKTVQVKSDLDSIVKATVEVAKEKSNDLVKKALDVAEKAVQRPNEMRLNDGTLVAKTGDKYAKHQAEQTRRRNRMRGIIT